MSIFLEFAKSDLGVGIAWACTVFSTLYAIYTTYRSKDMAKKIVSLNKIIDKSQTIDQGDDTVMQNGQKNVYTKNNSGGMKINM